MKWQKLMQKLRKNRKTYIQVRMSSTKRLKSLMKVVMRTIRLMKTVLKTNWGWK